MKKLLFILPLLSFIFASCLPEPESFDYVAWKKTNDEYIKTCEDSMVNGKKLYTRISPSWAPADYVLMKWHNDTTLTHRNLRPLSNSTVNVKYILQNVSGTTIQTSFASTTYGDSIYQSKPNQNIVGFWIALTNMHEGDSVTMVIPSNSAYGAANTNSIPAYSTLVYHVKMKKVVDLLKQ